MMQNTPRIGFVTATFKEPYQISVWNGALAAAAERGCSLLFASGGRLSSPVIGESAGNIAYSLITPSTVKGVIALSTTIGTFVDSRELRRFCKSFAPLPLVSVGISVAGFPSVSVDNAAGMRLLMKHLIEVHGYRRFALVSGPAHHQEADLRSGAFREILRAYGIREDPRAFAWADFTSGSGRLAIERFLAEDLIKPGRSGVEVIIAENDRMALAVIEALEDKGLRVPQDVAVVGFDDTEESHSQIPPLTTVRQPLFEMGRRALAILMETREGGAATDLFLEPDLVVRESCGCPPKAEEDDRGFRIAARARARHAALVARVGTRLTVAMDIKQLWESITQGAGALGIPRCFLSLYDGDGPLPEYSRLVLTAPPEPGLNPGPEGTRFPTRMILPAEVMERENQASLMVFSLHFGRNQQGFIVYEYAEGLPQYQDDFRDIIARTLTMAELMEKVRSHGTELEREVEAKTLELRQEMKRRRLLEKEVITISGEVMQRVGQDLHDGLSQKLAALSMLASALESRLSSESHPSASAAHELVSFLNEAVVDTREIARGLYPAELERNGLVPAVRELVSKAKRLSTIDIRLVVKGRPEIEDSSKAIQIYRIVQEALGNALKHSGAARITVFMEGAGDSFRVEIEDDGIGIPSKLSNTKGMGLRIMRYRANMIDGELKVQRLEKGTRVTVTGNGK
jgi:DNA-binding LacI/PurR family transcriptional regulator/signal transduction histidine kinase